MSYTMHVLRKTLAQHAPHIQNVITFNQAALKLTRLSSDQPDKNHTPRSVPIFHNCTMRPLDPHHLRIWVVSLSVVHQGAENHLAMHRELVPTCSNCNSLPLQCFSSTHITAAAPPVTDSTALGKKLRKNAEKK